MCLCCHVKMVRRAWDELARVLELSSGGAASWMSSDAERQTLAQHGAVPRKRGIRGLRMLLVTVSVPRDITAASCQALQSKLTQCVATSGARMCCWSQSTCPVATSWNDVLCRYRRWSACISQQGKYRIVAVIRCFGRVRLQKVCRY